MTKKSSGMFFKEASRPQEGHFFRDMQGREGGQFHQKTAMTAPTPDTTDVSNTETSMSASSTDGVGGMGSAGKGMGGGMYGSGKGVKKKDESEAERLAKLLKKASATPSDWDNNDEQPTGFHRPSKSQPEALEPGGDRFFSSDAPGPSFGVGQGVHGLVEGGTMSVRQGTGHQMGKHASEQRFLGTSFGIAKQAKITDRKEYEGARGYTDSVIGEAGKSLGEAGHIAANTADKAVKGIAGSPAAMGIAALLAARMGLKGVKGLGKGALRAAGHKPKASAGLVGRTVGSVKKLMS